ncbi:MAG: acetate--CoA ligase family protein, partial [Nanoarchaeota archaeon]|nr:acetate--CoA ligase family protein [Nanoarchaeota archaeon]
EQIEGIEMIIGLKQDKAFGKLLLVGFGGTFAETIKDTSFRALPISNKEIEKQISELKLCKVLVSRKKFAIDKFISLAEKISKLDINEADFNPIILNEKGAFIVDARIEV